MKENPNMCAVQGNATDNELISEDDLHDLYALFGHTTFCHKKADASDRQGRAILLAIRRQVGGEVNDQISLTEHVDNLIDKSIRWLNMLTAIKSKFKSKKKMNKWEKAIVKQIDEELKE